MIIDGKINNARLYRPSTVVISTITAVLYFLTARFSLLLAASDSNATSVWPPSGIALAIILLYGYRIGPAIFLGAFFANVLALKSSGLTPAYFLIASFTTAIGNMLEGIIGAYLIKRFSLAVNLFDTMRSLFIFIVLGGLAATIVSSTIGVGSFCYVTGKWPSFYRLWLTWWLGDAAGVLIVSPLIILAVKKQFEGISGIRLLEAIIVFFIIASSSLIIFRYNLNLEYAIIPPLIWIAFRFGRLSASGAVLLVSGIAVVCTISSLDALVRQFSRETLLYLQTYIGVISIMTLSLSVLAHERRQSDRDRITAQKQLYDIIEFLPDATFAIDTGGTVIAWNRAMEDLSGMSKREMIGKGDYEYAIPFFGERRPILIDIVMNDNDHALLETYEFTVKRGTTLYAEQYNSHLGRYLSSAASTLMDDEGNIHGAIESIRDITNQKAAEQELKHYKENLESIVSQRSAELSRANEQLIAQIEKQDRVEMALAESETKYRDLVESANSVIMRWKPDGSVSFFNVYAQEFFGFTEPEIIGKNVVGTIVPAMESSGRDLALLMEDIKRNPGAHVFNENENIRKNGEKVWIAWTNKPIFDRSGLLTEILSVGNDITVRKSMEESLRKTLDELAIEKERAEEADRIKSAFLATMSHELRTPLNSIIGFTGIMLQGLAGPLNEEQNKQMGMVRNSAQHLLSLINDVLDISKIEAGQLEVHAEPFDLRAIINKAVDALKPMAEKKGITLESIIKEGISEAFNDRRRVEQVLMNLLSNAIKFTEKGSVTLKAEIVLNYYQRGIIDGSKNPHAVKISVSDTGIGIQPDDMKKLFQPFRQIDTGLSRKNEGTGLGLAICRKLADLMNGEITAESDWGRGSVFSFIMPLGKTEDQ